MSGATDCSCRIGLHRGERDTLPSMAAKIHKMGESLYVFHCPGCKYGHHVDVKKWTWNQSMDAPTFTPSLLVNQHHLESRCHSHVTDGKIQFLADCYHALAGKTVDLPDWDD